MKKRTPDEPIAKGTKIRLERMAHVSNAKVAWLTEAPIDRHFHESLAKAEDSYVATDDVRDVEIEAFGADSKGCNPWVAVWFGGVNTFRLNTGWGEKPVRDYRICKKDLERLRDHVAQAHGFKCAPQTDRTRRKRPTRRPKAAPTEQLELSGPGETR